MRTLNLKPSAERGLSIVELMIAMVLGLLLIAGVLQVFLGNRQAQRVEQSVSRIEENGRVAMDLLVQDLRMTGYYGCSRMIKGEIVPAGKSPVFTKLAKAATYNAPVSDNFLSSSLRGFQRKADGVWTPVLPADLSTSPTDITGRKGSDAIALYYGQPTGMVLKADVSDTAEIEVNNPDKFDIPPNRQALISNCAITDFFTVTNDPSGSAASTKILHAAAGNDSASLSTVASAPYGVSSKISLFVDRVYYVKETGRTSPDGTEVYSLWRRENNGTPQELVEGIEFLHFLYGEQLASGKVRYVPASTAGLKWENVINVQVSLLAKSYDSVRTDADTSTYKLLDQSIGAVGDIAHSGQLSLRRVYTATVELRNRVE